MQIYVKGSNKAVPFYQKAFDAKLVSAYPNEDGTYMHCELDVYGQILAVAEPFPEMGDVTVGNNMQFCLHMGEGKEETVRKAYDVLKDGAQVQTPIGECPFSPLMFGLTDMYGVNWCIFV